MVYITAGYFLMGSAEQDGIVGLEVGLDEMPQHQVYVKGFYIDRYEVTNGQYYEFVKATGGYTPATWDYRQHPSGKSWPLDTPPPGEENYPVTDIDWYDADAYCKWASKRLPTEAEWEKAARGTDGRIWPWGNVFDSAKVNTLESGKNWSMPVGSYSEGISPYGIHDMIGNAWEWTASWYQAYPGSELQRAAFGEKYRVLRGGSYLTPVQPFARVTHRYAPQLLPMELRDSNWHIGFDVGFRCAKDLD
jgi:formylglycine-generating enzyme required for sulfatase activity